MLSAEEYERLKQDMINLGIDFGRKDASCTLSETPESLETDFEVHITLATAQVSCAIHD